MFPDEDLQFLIITFSAFGCVFIYWLVGLGRIYWMNFTRTGCEMKRSLHIWTRGEFKTFKGGLSFDGGALLNPFLPILNV